MSATERDDKDPLIDEVRERRRQVSKRYGGDLQKIYEAIQELQRSHPQIVAKPQRK